jgi:acetoin utilization deacetylase AcuC-like enzyme
MLPFKLVYHPGYDLRLGAHVFPSQKFRLVCDALVERGIAAPADILAPEPASDQDILRVHTPEWVEKLKHDTLSASERMRLEIPYSREAVEAFWLAAGGSILAAHCAQEDGFGVNLGGGFHHAFPGHGEGFCMIHDVAVAIRRLQAEGAIRKVLVVDTDVHQGNGTAAIFAADPDVFTLSLHQENNYPVPKPPSDLDVNLDDGTGDEQYLELLARALAQAFSRFQPEMLFYVGGADPYREDQLGGLWLSLKGLQQRDALVFAEARQRSLPVVVTLAGGYARNVEDTVRIHVNTVLAARDTVALKSIKQRNSP